MSIIPPSPVFRWFVPAQSGTGLVPAAGYKAKWYSSGTLIAKTIYDDLGAAYPSPSNVATLNSQGYASIRLGDGVYSLIVTDANDVPVFTEDNIQGGGNFSTGIVPTVFTDLPGVNTNDYPFVYCMGYYAIGDGGHGFFWNATSSSSPDGGYIVASTVDGTKRWFRVPDESGDVRAASFGYIGTKSGNLSTQLTNASAYTFGRNLRLVIGPGNVAKVGTSGQPFSIYTGVIHFEGAAVLTADTGVTTLLFPVTTTITGTNEPHWSGFTTVTFPGDLIMPDPTFFGASEGGDNTTAFAAWIAASTGNASFILPPGTWPYSVPTAFPFPQKPMLLWGTIGSGGSAIPPGVYFPNGSRFRFGTLLLKDGQTITSDPTQIIFNGSTYTVGNVNATAQGNFGGSVTASSLSTTYNISAGTVMDFKAGASTHSVRVAGRYLTTVVTGSTYTTSGTTETTLIVGTIYANSMATIGDHMRLFGAGTSTTATSVGRRWRVRIGGSADLLFDIDPNFQAGTGAVTFTNWRLTLDIFYLTSTTCLCTGTLETDFVDGGGVATVRTSSTPYYGVKTITTPWTSDQSINVTATASTSGSVTQNLLTLDYTPAP